jgi:hypothetical protein
VHCCVAYYPAVAVECPHAKSAVAADVYPWVAMSAHLDISGVDRERRGSHQNLAAAVSDADIRAAVAAAVRMQKWTPHEVDSYQARAPPKLLSP